MDKEKLLDRLEIIVNNGLVAKKIEHIEAENIITRLRGMDLVELVEEKAKKNGKAIEKVS